MTTPPLMIFAAGFGTRMGELTRSIPKPLIPVGGRALIDHTIALAHEAGLPHRQMVVNTHYLGHQIAAHLAGTGIRTSHESPDILDTGGGLRQALPMLGARDVLTANSDAIWRGPNPFDMAMRHWDPDQMGALMICVPRTRCIGRVGPGDLSLSRAGAVTFGGDHVYGGIHLLNTDHLSAIPDRVFSLLDLWHQLARDRRLFGLAYPGWWCDVGNPDGLKQAEELVAHEPH